MKSLSLVCVLTCLLQASPANARLGRRQIPPPVKLYSIPLAGELHILTLRKADGPWCLGARTCQDHEVDVRQNLRVILAALANSACKEYGPDTARPMIDVLEDWATYLENPCLGEESETCPTTLRPVKFPCPPLSSGSG